MATFPIDNLKLMITVLAGTSFIPLSDTAISVIDSFVPETYLL